jgi:hypothetical protein
MPCMAVYNQWQCLEWLKINGNIWQYNLYKGKYIYYAEGG